MTKKIFYFIFSSALLMSCGNEKEAKISKVESKDKIASLEQQLFNSKQMFNDSAARALVDAYDEFASMFPEDTLAPDYIFKAGEVSLGLNLPAKSVNYFKKAYEQYPQYERAAYSLFLHAYVLDNHLNDDESAEEIYQSFIQKYPDHPMVKDAAFSIKNLGKSDEELIKEFEKMNDNVVM